MTDGYYLLQAIFDEPTVDAHRLVFADWLEENGQETWANFIRRDDLHQFRKDEGQATAWSYSAGPGISVADLIIVYRVIEELGGDNWPLGSAIAFRRGFVTSVSCTYAVWEDRGKEIASNNPLERVDLTDKNPARPPNSAEPHGYGWWFWDAGPSHLAAALEFVDPNDLPKTIWDDLTGGIVDKRSVGAWRLYESEEAAHAICPAYYSLARNCAPLICQPLICPPLPDLVILPGYGGGDAGGRQKRLQRLQQRLYW